jgi:hypothetical protein
MTRIYVPSNTSLLGWRNPLWSDRSRGSRDPFSIQLVRSVHPSHVYILFILFLWSVTYVYRKAHKKKTEPHPSSSHRQIDRNISSYCVQRRRFYYGVVSVVSTLKWIKQARAFVVFLMANCVCLFFYYRTTSYDVTDRRNIVHRMLGKILTSFDCRFVLFSYNIDLKIRTNSIWRY